MARLSLLFALCLVLRQAVCMVPEVKTAAHDSGIEGLLQVVLHPHELLDVKPMDPTLRENLKADPYLYYTMVLEARSIFARPLNDVNTDHSRALIALSEEHVRNIIRPPSSLKTEIATIVRNACYSRLVDLSEAHPHTIPTLIRGATELLNNILNGFIRKADFIMKKPLGNEESVQIYLQQVFERRQRWPQPTHANLGPLRYMSAEEVHNQFSLLYPSIREADKQAHPAEHSLQQGRKAAFGPSHANHPLANARPMTATAA